ncbi:MAG TPA: helicase HerA-like domain-containing protein, partial [Clostridiaceae bacterium]|nr:helicase HerA-like domain-containing protein [Clostridiaceae bacterium]
MGSQIHIGKGINDSSINTNMLSRHGLIAGATGTGKTVTLKVIAEALSNEGIPVFLADVKGDLGSLTEAGQMNDKLQVRLQALGLQDFAFQSFPVEFWDVLQQKGLPVRTTVSDMGPVLLSRLLGLNDIQEGVLNIAFKLADDKGMLLIDLKDLKAMCNYVADNASVLIREYGNISRQTVGAIMRSLLVIEEQGGDLFFGEPALDIRDLMKTDVNGRGVINILASDKLFLMPKLYSTFLLWFLSELFEELPEAGDLEKPKIVFFFDEAHLLFEDTPEVLLDQIEMMVKLIRSKGVGIFFVTQNPADIPDPVLAQLGNRVQHALRAYTPKEQKAVKTAAETFRQKEGQNVETMITELRVGEALVSTLDENGIPSYVDRVTILPPRSKFGTADPAVLKGIISGSALYGKYAGNLNRD